MQSVSSAALAVVLPALKSDDASGTRRVGHWKAEHRVIVNGTLRVVVPSMPISHSQPRVTSTEQSLSNGRSLGRPSDICEIGQMPEVPPGMNDTPHALELLQLTGTDSSSVARKGRGTTQARPPLMSAVV